MFKIFKNKLMMTFIAMAVVSGISTQTLPMFHNVHTTIKKLQASNIKEKTEDFQNTQKNSTNKNLNSSTDSAPSDYDENDNNINNQETINSELEKSSNNETNKQKASGSQLQEANSNINTENQKNTNTTLEVGIPTIYYDRTTSIYANDNITLLRIEYYINNKLTYYSVIEQFDASTKSYTERIYQCNLETNIDPLVRTDIYSNGNLIRSY